MKRALVISGGGSKGAFAVGILQRLRLLFPRLRFNTIIGTSTGALIAPFAATGDVDLLEELYTSYTTDEESRSAARSVKRDIHRNLYSNLGPGNGLPLGR